MQSSVEISQPNKGNKHSTIDEFSPVTVHNAGQNAAIVGGSAGGLVLVVLVIGFIWFCILRYKKFSNKSSETGSSDPSTLVEWNRGGGSASVGGPALSGPQGGRQFALEELEQATKQFSVSNLIGHGSFGSVYKGLLCDGTIVAVKRRCGAPKQELVEEVYYLSEIQHRNLVTLLGYCQEAGSQMLVFEYLPNDSVGSHLYGNGQESQDSTTQLEFKQRLSIALGAAKGLCYLHCMTPPLVHKNFKTVNVLVDENFIAKVADAGISRLLERIEDAGPSSRRAGGDVFRDPEVGESGTVSELSDVYSFGVFLWELVSGQETSRISFLESGGSLTQWVKSCMGSDNLVDSRLTNSFTSEGMVDVIRLTLRCLHIIGRGRPRMDMVVSELDRILEKEMTQTTVSTATVTLGSQLFTSQ